MIRGRFARTGVALLLIVSVALLFGLRAADPRLADPTVAAQRAATLAQAEAAAAAATSSVGDLLRVTIDDARLGAARTIVGNDPPADPLLAAAARLEAGIDDVQNAARAFATLDGTARAVDPGSAMPAWQTDPADLASIAGQLRDAAGAATAFVGHRQATETVLAGLASALAYLHTGDPALAASRLVQTRAPIDELAGWQAAPSVLSVWLDTTRRVIDAVDAMVSATLAGDQASLNAAEMRYAAIAGTAREADTALAIALTEGAAATTAVPLARLGRLLGEVERLRLAVTAVRSG